MSFNGRVIEGSLVGRGRSFAIIVARFNSFITERLLEGAVDCLRRHEVADADIEVIRVPGAWEIPVVLRRVAAKGGYDAAICLGAVIRGGTPHFDYVAAEVSKGVAAVSMETGLPAAFGVLTTDSVDQAVERAGTKAGNKGWEAAATALEMADLFAGMEEGRS